MEWNDEEEPTFWQKRRVPLLVGGILLFGGVAWLVFGMGGEKKESSSAPSVVNVALPPPPPPLPPPPPPPPPRERPPEPEMQQETEFVPEESTDPEPAAAEDSAPALGTGITGDGPPDGFGLGTKGGGGRFGGIGGGGGAGSKFGAYAGKIQRSIADALKAHRKTRNASLMLKVRVWADANGRITQVKLSGTSGDAKLDAALRDEVLTGLQLPEPPPDGMPMPIVMRITGQRP